LNFPDVAVQKEADNTLWKNCFYRQIENFRHSLKKAARGSVDVHLLRLSTEFEEFLARAECFYQNLLRDIEERLRANQMSKDSVVSLYRCIHSSLLYLGDLARYKETTKDPKNWQVAEKYYERAAFLCPELGNAQNQLAVLASYENSDFVALYRYARCIIFMHTSEDRPDVVRATENLRLLFAKNVIDFKSLDLHQFGRKQNTHHVSLDKRKRPCLEGSSFLIMFIRLHGVLYEVNESYKSNSTSKNSMLFEFFSKMTPLLLGEFESLLVASVFSEALLFRMLVINLFSVHHSTSLGKPSRSRCVCESFGLAFLFSWIKM
jgi:hypothetical protein